MEKKAKEEMKYVIVTDSHLGVKQGSELYHDVSKRLFTEICEYAESVNAEGLIHAGDFFDNRKSISNKTIIVALDIMEQLNSTFTEIHLITGNHDTIWKGDNHKSLLRMFEKFQHVEIVTGPSPIYGNILLLPYNFNLDELENKGDWDILIGHFDVHGAAMNESGSISQHGIKQSEFKNFKTVLSGHFHTPSVYGNIQYLGSPFHTTFNDVAGTRGFYVLDTDTQELEFIEFDDYPKFIRITDAGEYSKEVIEGNIVELIFTKDHGINKNIDIIENVKKCNPLTLKPKYVKIDEMMSKDDVIEDELEMKDHLGILFDYFEQCEIPEHLNIVMLKKVAKMIYKETVSE